MLIVLNDEQGAQNFIQFYQLSFDDIQNPNVTLVSKLNLNAKNLVQATSSNIVAFDVIALSDSVYELLIATDKNEVAILNITLSYSGNYVSINS